MKYLLIDIGSTNIKSAICDGADLSAAERVPFPAPLRDDGVHFEVDPGEILSRVRGILDNADCDGVLFSVQMHGWLLSDGKNLLTPYISWRDRRTGGSISLCVPRESGTSMKANLPRAGVAAFSREQPALFARAAEFFTLGSYIAFSLTGRNATHITDAAASGFYDVKAGTAAECGLRLRLPEAAYAVSWVGNYRGKRIYTPCGDQQCSVLGAGGGRDCYVLNLGTAAQLCTVEKGFAEGDFESRPWFGGDTLCTVTGLSGGKALQDGGKDAAALAAEYLSARAKLPVRKKLLVTGGALRWHHALIADALGRMGIPYFENEGADALEGLKELASGIRPDEKKM